MICFAAMWSTNSSIHARNASIGGIVSANLRCGRGQLFHFTAIHRFDQGIARGKVTIQSSRAHARLFGDIVQAGVGAKAGKRLLRHLQYALAVPLRIACAAFAGRVVNVSSPCAKYLQPETVSDYLFIRRLSPFYLKRQ